MRRWIVASVVSVSVSVSGCSDSDSGTAYEAQAGLCVDTINQYRASAGLPAFARWTDAEPCANIEAQRDAQTGTAHGAFGTCHETAQDECPGWGGPIETVIADCLKDMWNEGPGGGHHDNMASSRSRAACGFYVTAEGKVWALQDFQ